MYKLINYLNKIGKYSPVVADGAVLIEKPFVYLRS